MPIPRATGRPPWRSSVRFRGSSTPWTRRSSRRWWRRFRAKIAAMRASSYGGSGRFTTVDAPRPKPGAGEALLRVLRVGICGTDLHIFQGHLDYRVPKGGVIGHETFAEVVEAPAGSGFAAGDRVGGEPVISCGEWRACRVGASY